ncbi:MAG: hypothetical protein WDZ29_03315 [Balneolaceae bacterium]
MKTVKRFIVNQRLTANGKRSANTTQWPEKKEPELLKHQVNEVSADDEHELLLPTGMSFESEEEKPIQRNVTAPEGPMYPAGINPK